LELAKRISENAKVFFIECSSSSTCMKLIYNHVEICCCT
jgi:hypothetical protein